MIRKKKAINLTLVLPSYQSIDNITQDLDKIGLAELALRGRLYSGPSLEARLFKLLISDREDSPPYAALAALGEGLMAAQQGYWMAVDPIELLVDAGNIYSLGKDHLALEKAECQQLQTTLNGLLSEDGLEIQATSPGCWFVSLDKRPQISTYPLSQVILKDIKPFLPIGHDHNKWRKLLTELQMLLFQHEVNAKRQLTGKPMVNSIWFWGEGVISKDYKLNPFTCIWNDNPLVKGLLLQSAATVSCQKSKEFAIANLTSPGSYLAVLNHYQLGSAHLMGILSDVFTCLQARRLHLLTILLGNGTAYTWQARFPFRLF